MITMARKAAILPALLATFSAGPLRAGDRACSSPTVAVDGEVRARWPDLGARVQGAFDGRGDVDACARIALRANRASIVVDVVLMDGRAASRSVSRADDVVPTLEALLLLPTAGAPAPPPEPARARTPAVAAAPARATETRPTDSKPIVATEARLASAV